MEASEQPFRILVTGKLSFLVETGEFDQWIRCSSAAKGRLVRGVAKGDGLQTVTYLADDSIEETYVYHPCMGRVTTFSVVYQGVFPCKAPLPGHN